MIVRNEFARGDQLLGFAVVAIADNAFARFQGRRHELRHGTTAFAGDINSLNFSSHIQSDISAITAPAGSSITQKLLPPILRGPSKIFPPSFSHFAALAFTLSTRT